MDPRGTRHELRTYTLRPGAIAEAERRLAAFEEAGTELVGSWSTDVGPLNRVVQLWACTAPTTARPATLLVELQAAEAAIEPLVPFAFSPPLPGENRGPWYELRIYAFRETELERLTELWRRALPERIALSPLAGIWYTRDNTLCRLIHLWPYGSLDERARVRAEALSTRRWPPSAVARTPSESYRVESQESWILVPSAFSPLR